MKNLLKNIQIIIFDFDGTIMNLDCDWERIKQLRAKGDLNEPEIEDIEYAGALRGTEVEGIGELIKSLKCKKAIFSMNSSRSIFVGLAVLELTGQFSMVVSRNDVEKYKPEPEGLEKILTALHISKKCALYVGDRKIDILTGKNAGVKTMLIKEFLHDYSTV